MPLTGALPEGGAILPSSGERERAASFADPVSRRRYTLTRLALRRVLGGLLEIMPGEVPLGVADGGKPILLPAAPRRIEFNYTHTDGLALIAVAPGSPVGIDVERADRHADFQAIAARFFTEEEQAFLRKEPGETLFLHIWTRKEAVLKAAGTGLAAGMKSCSVARAEGWNARIPFGGCTYEVREVAVPEGYVAALACAVADGAA